MKLATKRMKNPCGKQRQLTGLELALRFMRLAELDNGAFERLGRYEAALWRHPADNLYARSAEMAVAQRAQLANARPLVAGGSQLFRPGHRHARARGLAFQSRNQVRAVNS